MTSYTTAVWNYRVADVLPDLAQRADWRAVRALFSQQVEQIDSGSRSVPNQLAEAFADALERISATYAMDYDTMCLHAMTVLADEEHMEYFDIELFRKYYEFDILNTTPGTASALRWRPGTGEAIVETCRRLRDIRSVRAALQHKGSSGLLIGSMNYGRFYNIRGNRYGERASDLDLIIVVDEATDLIALADALAGVRCVRNSDVDRFRRRAEVFIGELDDEGTVFSHKIQLWSDSVPDPMVPRDIATADYLLSIHVMTPPVLKYVLVGSTPHLLKEISGRRRTLRDYREAQTDRWDDVFDFAGRRHRTALDEVEAQGGWLRFPRCYYIDDHDCYFPGFYQSMFMPGPELLWDDHDIRFPIIEFQYKLDQRLQDEASRRRPIMLRPSFAHIRRDEFAPHVIRSLDGPYSGS